MLHYTYIACLVGHLILFSLNPSWRLCNGEKLRVSAFPKFFYGVLYIYVCLFQTFILMGVS